MRIWIDTEFNDFKGELISMALVAENGSEYYEATYCPKPSKWVAENVIPVLNRGAISRVLMQDCLAQYLKDFKDEPVHIIADWPEDIAHFCNLLITGPGHRLNTPPLTMEIRRDLDCTSAIPHNALEDARAIMRKHLELEKCD